ncbi:MAG: diguanylate cyclase [Rhodospirillales bacterium]|nr:diguanylate cyclase [Rhodospirillales bacterium]
MPADDSPDAVLPALRPALKPKSLVFLLAIVLTLSMLAPVLVLGWMSYGFARDQIRDEKIRKVGWVSETRREQLLTVLVRTNARVRAVLDDTERRCGKGSGAAGCLREALQIFMIGERADGAVWRGDGVVPVVVGSFDWSGADERPLKAGQLARLLPSEPGKERHYAIRASTEAGSRLEVAFPASVLQEIFVNHPDLGQSGETFLADEEGYFVTKARYESTQGNSHPIDARPMRTCLSRVDSETLDLDYRDVHIIHGFRFVPEMGGGCIMAHIDQREAFAELGAVKWRVILAALAFLMLAVAAARVIAGRIARPILSLTAATRAIIAGNYGVRTEEGGPAEIGELARSFNQMLERLKFTLGELQENEHTLEARIRLRTAELAEANRKLEALSFADGLTGLGNRRQLDQALAAEWRRAIRQGQPLAFLFLDVDEFKAYNDRYGHPMGDACLRQIGEVLARFGQRAGEVAGRYGGEEFALLLPATGQAEAHALGESIRRAVADLVMPHDRSAAGIVTVSVGVAALRPTDALDMAELVHQADQALYQAKALGRNRVVAAGADELSSIP